MILVCMVMVFGLIHGSFLNMLAWRLTFEKSLLTMRSYCPICTHVIAWYDNIPVLSYIMLGGKCRHCHNGISCLYPCIELATGLVIVLLWSTMTLKGVLVYTLPVSALIMATRSDLEAMVIPQVCTMFLVPIAIVLAAFGLLPITLYESLLGFVLGYSALWLVAYIFKAIMKKDGLGEGDIELLAMIGAFWGPMGVWGSLTIGSTLGSLLGALYIYTSKKGRGSPIPFGPFLSLGLFIYFFAKAHLLLF